MDNPAAAFSVGSIVGGTAGYKDLTATAEPPSCPEDLAVDGRHWPEPLPCPVPEDEYLLQEDPRITAAVGGAPGDIVHYLKVITPLDSLRFWPFTVGRRHARCLGDSGRAAPRSRSCHKLTIRPDIERGVPGPCYGLGVGDNTIETDNRQSPGSQGLHNSCNAANRLGISVRTISHIMSSSMPR